MSKPSNLLRDALKKIITQLKPQHKPIALTLLIGRAQQGKSTLLRQSQFEHAPVPLHGVEIFFNSHGIVIEFSETWLEHHKQSLSHTIKQINRSHRLLQFSGALLCIDVNEILTAQGPELKNIILAHARLLELLAPAFSTTIELGLICTKLDLLSGFCDFFQSDHTSELQKPLGFSFQTSTSFSPTGEVFKTQFDQLVMMLGQQVIHKIHPVRSSAKRTLIREFPLQLASLRHALMPLMTRLPPVFQLQALYFTSAEQGGVSTDWLNKKIKREYALTLQDQFHQSVNHRAYFTQGALENFQLQTKLLPSKLNRTQQQLLWGLVGVTLIVFLGLSQRYIHSSHLLDKVSQELIASDSLGSTAHTTRALHLTKASQALMQIPSNTTFLPTIQSLKAALQSSSKQVLNEQFLPNLRQQIEQSMSDAQATPVARYQALKVYLMLEDTKHRNIPEIIDWFRDQWKTSSQKQNIEAELKLLQQILAKAEKSLPIHKQLVTDTRNFLNALPPSYLYYALAKTSFSKEMIPLNTPGFNASQQLVPVYLTKPGCKTVMTALPEIVNQLKTDNWILARQDLADLLILLQQAYCYEYVIWWQHWMQSLHLNRAEDEQSYTLIHQLRQSDTLTLLIHILQEQTGPDTTQAMRLFNQEIASKFSELNLISESSLRQLRDTLGELEKFLQTLSVVNDQGKMAFQITKARFEGDALANPISALYSQSHQLPEPISIWAKELADDAWFNLINQSRDHLNHQWQSLVFQAYQSTIAHRYPFDSNAPDEISMNHFEHFFSTHGLLNRFVNEYLKPFLDTSKPQWQLKAIDNYVMPISSDTLNELIRANVITHMFFPDGGDNSEVQFSLQKVSLDPIVANLQLSIGDVRLKDTQATDSLTEFHWPQSNALLVVNSIEGQHYELEELGIWAFFKLLQKVNVLVDEQDSSNLQIVFEINGNAGRYLLKAQNPVNPFIPGILSEFSLSDVIA